MVGLGERHIDERTEYTCKPLRGKGATAAPRMVQVEPAAGTRKSCKLPCFQLDIGRRRSAGRRHNPAAIHDAAAFEYGVLSAAILCN